MSKETKDLLKTLLANQDLIMKHLGIAKGGSKDAKKKPEVSNKKSTAKLPAKKTGKVKK